MILSIKNTTDSCSFKNRDKKNKNAIWGINIKIPPIPGMIPCDIKFVKTPEGKDSLAKVQVLSSP
jgi:hypothetical protein